MERIRVISVVWCIEANEGGIRDKEWQIKLEDTIPLIDNLEIGNIFKDKAKKGGWSGLY